MTEIVKYQNTLTKYQPTTLDEIVKLAELFSSSGMFNAENQRQSAAQIAVKILAGQELGLTPFASTNGMQIIKGKCAPGANLMAALVKASGRYNYRVTEMTDAKVAIDFFENGKAIGTSTFTSADAAKAGTQNMQKFARNMLFARAISNGVRWFCPDLANGVAMYTPEELGATVDYETGEIIESAPQPRQLETSQTPPQRQPMSIETPPFDDEQPAEQPATIQPVEVPEGMQEFVSDLLLSLLTPKDCWAWAAAGHTDNEHSARNRWNIMVKEAGGYTPAKFNALAKMYVIHYLTKETQHAAVPA